MRRIVITGLGAVTPLGNDVKTTWENLARKVSGIDYITKFDPAGLTSRIAGEVKNFCPENFLPKKDIRRLDPFIHYAVAAATTAVEDAGLISKGSDSSLDSAGIVIGSSRGGITTLEKSLAGNINSSSRYSPYLMPSTTISMAPSYISIKLGIKGSALGISTACASGTNAIGEAVRMIRHGEIDMALAGGSEAPICKISVGGYAASGALSRRNQEPQKASRPFDIDRDGFVISEGSGILVLEELQQALKRGAHIYAEIAGYGTSSDAFHQTKPDSEGEALAINRAVKDAGISIEEVDYINAHATSTPLGDLAESIAIKKIFGKRVNDIYVSSCKSMLGHMLGAAGAVEAAITAMSINKGIIIPTVNLEAIDPACDLNHVTETTEKEINTAITNSFGFGGVNAVLVLRKFRG